MTESRVDALTARDLPGRSPDQRVLAARGDLLHRLALLPNGHPSSPRRADGSARPPVPQLRHLELTDEDPPDHNPVRDPAEPDLADPGPVNEFRPLTDEEHAEHVADVRARLDKAAAGGLATDLQYTIDPAREIWSAERDALHDQLIEDLYGEAAQVPSEHRAIIAGGLGGAGKTTILSDHANIDRSQYLTINPDEIKVEMARRGMIPEVEGLSPLEASSLVHEESSHIAKRIDRRAEAAGKNILWDITMSSRPSVESRIDALRSNDYTQIVGIFVDIPVETSVSRAEGRHRDGHDQYRAGHGLGGRHVPAEAIRTQSNQEWGSQNRQTFEAVKHRFDAWSRYNNSVDGVAAVLAESSRRLIADDKREETTS